MKPKLRLLALLLIAVALVVGVFVLATSEDEAPPGEFADVDHSEVPLPATEPEPRSASPAQLKTTGTEQPAPPPAPVPEVADTERSNRRPIGGPPPPPVGGSKVERSVARGVAWLHKRQSRHGSWGHIRGSGGGASNSTPPFESGMTSLVLYSLLSTGRSNKDPTVKRGFAYLRKTHKLPNTAPEASMLLLAVAATADIRPKTENRPKTWKLSSRYRAWAIKLVEHLLKGRRGRAWRYGLDAAFDTQYASSGRADLITTHQVALALLAAHRCGIKVKAEVWEGILDFALEQRTDGGFAYMLGSSNAEHRRATGGTTAAGHAVLSMANAMVPEYAATRPADEAQAEAMGWLNRHWSTSHNPGKSRDAPVSHAHWLWMLETAMDLSGKARIGAHYWYREVVRGLLRRQETDGHWKREGPWEPAEQLDTAFTVLVLSRATRRLLP